MEEYTGLFYISMEAETAKEAALLVRIGLNQRRGKTNPIRITADSDSPVRASLVVHKVPRQKQRSSMP